MGMIIRMSGLSSHAQIIDIKLLLKVVGAWYLNDKCSLHQKVQMVCPVPAIASNASHTPAAGRDNSGR